jgi:hypothetical protein
VPLSHRACPTHTGQLIQAHALHHHPWHETLKQQRDDIIGHAIALGRYKNTHENEIYSREPTMIDKPR